MLLPDDFEFRPEGGNALETDERFLNTTCPSCSGKGRRETDTMDTFVDSSWYWWRYLSPHKDDGPFDTELEKKWCPVDQYTGGAEHAVLHLLYARFFTKALNDMGLVHEREPWLHLFNQGQILGADGERMSKSRGNVQDPDDLVSRYGADTVRLFLMFMGPWDQGGPWSPTGIEGVNRFLRRVWTWSWIRADARCSDASEGSDANADALLRQAHRTLAKVTEDHADFHWNTMISALMELTNEMFRVRGTAGAATEQWDETVRLLLLMLAPIAPHISEELWSRRAAARGEEWTSVHAQRWPELDPSLVAMDTDRSARSGQRPAARRRHRAERDVRSRDRADRPGARQDKGPTRRPRGRAGRARSRPPRERRGSPAQPLGASARRLGTSARRRPEPRLDRAVDFSLLRRCVAGRTRKMRSPSRTTPDSHRYYVGTRVIAASS